ncbi:hypothetical protein LJK87_06850 [Paenibacillus sp. P25]|nr:hypothetical protein LJK87_06850 [Paenibacillus sp. P25]
MRRGRASAERETGTAVGRSRFNGEGEEAALRLRTGSPLSSEDAVVAGPALRSLQTARLWCEGTACARFVHPLAGPRQHPFVYDFRTPPCDRPMEPEHILAKFSEMLLAEGLPEPLWSQGIHTSPSPLFTQHAERFLAWCGNLDQARVFVVTDPGTVRAYQSLGYSGFSGMPGFSIY